MTEPRKLSTAEPQLAAAVLSENGQKETAAAAA